MTLPALEQAITFLSRADLIATARQQSLPAGVTEILKISSGDNDALIVAQESSRLSLDDVRHAAQFYVQQILFAPDSDYYRVLGVDPDDVEAKIKLHYRLLVRWLHPDKNSSDWEVVFSDRVNRAWHSLRTPERRREYDAKLKSQSNYQPADISPSRKLEPGHLRRSNVDERFMSSRTIKRLPIAVFGMLGLGAMFALWWLSQLQPSLQTQEIANVEPVSGISQEPTPAETQPTQESRSPAASVAASSSPQNNAVPELLKTTSVEQLPAEKTLAFEPQVVVEQVPEKIADIPQSKPVALKSGDAVAPAIKTIAAAPKAKAVTHQPDETAKAIKAIAAAPREKAATQAAPEKNLQPIQIVKESANPAKTKAANDTKELAARRLDEKPVRAVSTRNDVDTAKLAAAPAVASASPAVSAPEKHQVSSNTSDVRPVKNQDANVRQFLQQFSRVYADGDYFALHNLFTRDLSILSAPPQRSVLRSYRQLFESSQSREIALDHVTWLANEDNIVVIASYQTQVLPNGKAEVKSARGDIRLDLRMENGQLKIIRLQSDTKNG